MKGLDVYDFEKAQDKENLMADIKAGKTLAGLQRQTFRDQQNQVCSTGLPRHRENREFESPFFQTGKTQGIC